MDTNNKGRIIIISAPSGCGKSTIINAIMKDTDMDLQFSVSATNRQPREGEKHGVNYFFMTDDEFRRQIRDNNFVEFEEVYPGRFYGTLRSEVERTCDSGHNVILDIDVKGGVNVKKMYGDRAVSIFIMPPDINTLRERLESRGTDTPEVINERIGKAAYEMSFADCYDYTVVNDVLDKSVKEVESIIRNAVSDK